MHSKCREKRVDLRYTTATRTSPPKFVRAMTCSLCHFKFKLHPDAHWNCNMAERIRQKCREIRYIARYTRTHPFSANSFALSRRSELYERKRQLFRNNAFTHILRPRVWERCLIYGLFGTRFHSLYAKIGRESQGAIREGPSSFLMDFWMCCGSHKNYRHVSSRLFYAFRNPKGDFRK